MGQAVLIFKKKENHSSEVLNVELFRETQTLRSGVPCIAFTSRGIKSELRFPATHSPALCVESFVPCRQCFVRNLILMKGFGNDSVLNDEACVVSYCASGNLLIRDDISRSDPRGGRLQLD